MFTFGITLALFVAVPVLYVIYRLLPYSASLAGSAGFIFYVVSFEAGFGRGMRFFGGLFVFCLALFVLGGGMRGR